MNIVQLYKEQFDKTIDFLKTDISGLRTGRATPALVDGVIVEAYGTKQPLKSVASVSVADAKTLVIEPWDKGLMQAVEAGLRMSPLGINPINDGKLIRLPLPELNQERRQELLKVLNQKMEQARISLRKVREEVRNAIESAEKNKQITEDEKFQYQDDLEQMVKEFNEQVKMIGEEKDKEITTI